MQSFSGYFSKSSNPKMSDNSSTSKFKIQCPKNINLPLKKTLQVWWNAILSWGCLCFGKECKRMTKGEFNLLLEKHQALRVKAFEQLWCKCAHQWGWRQITRYKSFHKCWRGLNKFPNPCNHLLSSSCCLGFDHSKRKTNKQIEI